MKDSKIEIEANKIANTFLISALPFPFLLLSLWYLLSEDHFWAGIISFSICFILVVSYFVFSNNRSE